MNNKKMKKLALSLGLVGAIGTGATLAFLSDTTGNLQNKFVFTQKGIKINLHEILLDGSVDANHNGRFDYNETGNTKEKTEGVQIYEELVPNQTLVKDPTVTVIKNSLDCNVFVSVTNANTNLRITDLNSNSWELVSVPEGYKGADNTLYYVYKGAGSTSEMGSLYNVVKTSSNDLDLDPVFQHVQTGNLDSVNGVTLSPITIKAAAVQADSNTDEEALITALTNLGVTKNN